MTDLPSRGSANPIPFQVNSNSQQISPVNPPVNQQVISSGVSSKEKELIKTSEKPPVEEVGTLPELAPELREVGVEQVSETVNIPQPVSEATGLTHAGPTTPVGVQPQFKVKVPLTDDQIKKGLHQKVADSILWLAYWCLRQIKMAQAKVVKKESY